ncbi:MAG: hypothetical protein LUE92_13670 [Clostridiales bacterium]|nr:hypothetical protein [Clostridiales bacterium]
MIKYICDRCGKALDDEPVTGYISANSRDKATGDLLDDNEFEDHHFCRECMEQIKVFIHGKPEETEPVIKESESVVEEPENESEPETGKKKRSRIDTGKIFALRKAGWPVKEIAAEMHLTSQQVSQQIYLHKDEYESKVLMKPGVKGERPKL